MTSETYHVNIKPLIVRLWHIPRRIKSTLHWKILIFP